MEYPRSLLLILRLTNLGRTLLGQKGDKSPVGLRWTWARFWTVNRVSGVPATQSSRFGHDRSDRCRWPVWPVWSVAAQVACSVAFSGILWWLLVPRTCSTPVAVWSWPIWVVELEMCFGSRVLLVGVSISFKKNFYRLPFTPPTLWSPDRSFRIITFPFTSWEMLII
jgi:hypothetical protein